MQNHDKDVKGLNIFQSIKVALKNVFSNKMRAFLTMLGIIIGVASVITITSIGAGTQAEMESQFDQLGVGKLTVTVRGSRNVMQSEQLSMDDYELIREFEEVRYITPTLSNSAEIKLMNPTETKTASLLGVGEDYRSIESLTLLHGRFINENDIDNQNKVCIINDTTAEKVFGYSDEEVLGERISVKTWRGSQKYTVIGVTENSNAAMESLYGDEFPESVIMPVTSLQKLTNTKTLSSLSIIVTEPEKADEAAELITTALDDFHNTEEKYYAQNLMNIVEQLSSVTSTVTLLISCVAGISLLVGGIGVMNIMLVTVTERTREIGIRKSIGAKNKNILVQFMIEAVILSGIGGALGLLAGWGGGILVGRVMNVTAVVSMNAVLIATGISVIIGVTFGVYPASKASKLDPIEALRFE